MCVQSCEFALTITPSYSHLSDYSTHTHLCVYGYHLLYIYKATDGRDAFPKPHTSLSNDPWRTSFLYKTIVLLLLCCVCCRVVCQAPFMCILCVCVCIYGWIMFMDILLKWSKFKMYDSVCFAIVWYCMTSVCDDDGFDWEGPSDNPLRFVQRIAHNLYPFGNFFSITGHLTWIVHKYISTCIIYACI